MLDKWRDMATKRFIINYKQIDKSDQNEKEVERDNMKMRNANGRTEDVMAMAPLFGMLR